MYSYKPAAKNFSRAYVRGVNASYKDLCAVCDSVRGRNVASAIEFLEAAAEGEKAIAYRTHNAGMGHRAELGGRKGGYPKKAAGIMLKLLESAYANAALKGLTNMKIKHISANKQDNLPRMSPKGKRMRMDYETANAQVVLEEISTPQWSKPRGAKKAARAQPKIPAPKKADETKTTPIITPAAKSAETKTNVNETQKPQATKPEATPAKPATTEKQNAQTAPAKAEAKNDSQGPQSNEKQNAQATPAKPAEAKTNTDEKQKTQ